ncbi:MAG: hypothetical protein OXU81_16835 [Gammaproteobacteria bacterium]|nr:hypothetical protein [Gammaproteobacteria bacterium]
MSPTALSMSPSASVSARLQSIMPAPVRSRSSFTIAAVIRIDPMSLSDSRTGCAQPCSDGSSATVPASAGALSPVTSGSVSGDWPEVLVFVAAAVFFLTEPFFFLAVLLVPVDSPSSPALEPTAAATNTRADSRPSSMAAAAPET